MFDALKRFVVGAPDRQLPRAPPKASACSAGLAVLSADALVVGGVRDRRSPARARRWAAPTRSARAQSIAGLIALLLLIIVSSYRQTIFAYPQGGGDYVVTKENIGTSASLVTAAALLIDYTLTVAVSIAAGVSAMTSALPNLHVGRVPMALAFIALRSRWATCAGVRESAKLFGIPVYFFLGNIFLLLIVGAWQGFFGTRGAVRAGRTGGLLRHRHHHDLHPADGLCQRLHRDDRRRGDLRRRAGVQGAGRAHGGADPDADGRPGHHACSSASACWRTTSASSRPRRETVVSQLARAIFGGRNVFYYMVQAATAMILVLAANTAFADFPRLAYFVARDRFMPRQFMNLGDKLAYSNGIVALSIGAAILIIVFRGDPHALIPLYMIGVFMAFTLSQTGMLLRWRRLKPPGWQFRAMISGLGAVVAAVVLGIVAVTKAHRRRVDRARAGPDSDLGVPADARALRQRGGAAVARGRRRRHDAPRPHRDRADRRRAARRAGGAALRQLARERRARGLREREPGIAGRAQARLAAVGLARQAGGAAVTVSIDDRAAAGLHRSDRAANIPTTTSPSCSRSSS